MKRIAQFEKVSFTQFYNSWAEDFGGTQDEIRAVYDAIKLPRRATSGSAGYDIFSPSNFVIKPGESLKIPTGIRCKIDEGWVLKLYPRSSLGFKFRLQLNNTVGIIDSDYYYSDNEGHIFIKLYNDSPEDKILLVEQGDAFAQGIIQQFYKVDGDNVNIIRKGGIGSTNGQVKK